MPTTSLNRNRSRFALVLTSSLVTKCIKETQFPEGDVTNIVKITKLLFDNEFYVKDCCSCFVANPIYLGKFPGWFVMLKLRHWNSKQTHTYNTLLHVGIGHLINTLYRETNFHFLALFILINLNIKKLMSLSIGPLITRKLLDQIEN